MIRIAIVEDDEKYHSICHKLLTDFDNQKKLGFVIHDFYSGFAFLENFKGNFDLVIMDVEMPQIDGLEVSRQIREIDKYVPIIIISHSAQYAIKGYKINAFGYIVKPIQEYDFTFVIEKAIKYIASENKNYIVVSSKSMIKKIDIDDICYIEVSSHILKIVTTNEEILIRDRIKKYDDILKDYCFARCDNSYLVNLKYCTNVDLKNCTVSIKNIVLPISRAKKKSFLEALTKYIGDAI